MLRLRALLALLTATGAIVSCGNSDEPRAGEQWCQSLQDRRLLFEPMERCLDEYDQAQRIGTQP